MKVRMPDKRPASAGIVRPSGRWRSFDIRLVTPMLGGGVSAMERDESMPVRAASIRGQLRYWWRLLQSGIDGKSLFTKERSIWGGVADTGEDHASQVILRVDCTSKPDPFPYNGIAEYALFPARKTQTTPERKLIREGLSFRLRIACDDALYEQHVLPALRWWLTFGGLGARTRRGAGSLEATGIEPVGADEAEKVGCLLRIRERDVHDSAIDAWKAAIALLREFRQGEGIGRAPGHASGNGPRIPGESLWPEADSIRRIASTHAIRRGDSRCPKDRAPDMSRPLAFPRASFGLPIVFKFKDDRCGDPSQTELMPGNGLERMASPVILTAYRKQNGRYVPAALLLPHEHIRHISLTLKPKDQEPRNFEAGEWWSEADAERVKPLKMCKARNALDAFMTFFHQGTCR
ncbi:MAG TPA: type III-B CRISPR module RAMP protein Cmr1 [Gammaproteobacteria bacterium]|nr:type III-B CRISPR module RAMP protein Cmr1 [Gammaproteobacteria bacterium]